MDRPLRLHQSLELAVGSQVAAAVDGHLMLAQVLDTVAVGEKPIMLPDADGGFTEHGVGQLGGCCQGVIGQGTDNNSPFLTSRFSPSIRGSGCGEQCITSHKEACPQNDKLLL